MHFYVFKLSLSCYRQWRRKTHCETFC